MAEELDPWKMLHVLDQLDRDRRCANPNPLEDSDLEFLRAEADARPDVKISDEGVYRILDELEDSRTLAALLTYDRVRLLLEEVQQARDLIEALQWMPKHTIDFADPEMYIDEVRREGWVPAREREPAPELPGLTDRLLIETAVEKADREFGDQNG